MESTKRETFGPPVGNEDLWQAVLGEIELSISRASFLTWFKNTVLLSNNDKEIVVGVPNVFLKHQLENKFNDLISKILKKNGVKFTSIEYKIYSPQFSRKSQAEESPILKAAARATGQGSALAHSYRQGINEKYTFENFIVGSANDLAYAASQAVAARPGKKYNPLFLYGGVGLGKTHLIQAIGNSITSKRPSAKVVYISMEQFVQEFLDAIRYKRNSAFVNYYRGADVLIVDDVHLIVGKEKTQEEFFNTFNALHQANKQIIISSDRPPGDIPTLTDRLRSRFSWGMSIDMQAPDLETRTAIVQSKAAAQGMALGQEVAEYLAKQFKSNIRELEGALNQLLAFCEMRGIAPSIAVATQQLSGQQSRPKYLNPKQVIERTAKYFHVSLSDILGPKRDKEIVVPRQIAMHLLRSELHLSFPRIARELGKKDHTTAMHSVEKIENEIAQNGELKRLVEDLRGQIYA